MGYPRRGYPTRRNHHLARQMERDYRRCGRYQRQFRVSLSLLPLSAISIANAHGSRTRWAQIKKKFRDATTATATTAAAAAAAAAPVAISDDPSASTTPKNLRKRAAESPEGEEKKKARVEEEELVEEVEEAAEAEKSVAARGE